MKCTRLYTDDAGLSQVEMIDVSMDRGQLSSAAPEMDLSDLRAASGLVFASIPAGWAGGWHTAPHRQYFVQLGGVIEVEVVGGTLIRTGPGDVTLIEDIHGSGHMTRVIGDEPVTGVFIRLPE